MKRLIAGILGALLLTGCPAEKTNETAAVATVATETTATTQTAAPTTAAPATTESVAPSTENQATETWAGQLKVAQPVSTLNYVGAESGDWVPMRFRNDSEAGKKILAACANDDLCEFTGTVQFLEEAPPPDASAVAEIIRVDSVKRLPPETR
jgi:hypothetical protein